MTMIVPKYNSLYAQINDLQKLNRTLATFAKKYFENDLLRIIIFIVNFSFESYYRYTAPVHIDVGGAIYTSSLETLTR